MQRLLRNTVWKMAEQKDVGPPLLMKTPKSQLTAKKPSTNKPWNLPKKTSNIQRQSRSHNKMGEGSNCYEIKSQTYQEVDPQLENNCITEVLPQEWSTEPHVRLSSLAVWQWEEQPQEHLALKVVGIDGRDSTAVGETETILKGLTQGPMCIRTRRKSSDLVRY